MSLSEKLLAYPLDVGGGLLTRGVWSDSIYLILAIMSTLGAAYGVDSLAKEFRNNYFYI
jgi:hypothetical protein